MHDAFIPQVDHPKEPYNLSRKAMRTRVCHYSWMVPQLLELDESILRWKSRIMQKPPARPPPPQSDQKGQHREQQGGCNNALTVCTTSATKNADMASTMKCSIVVSAFVIFLCMLLDMSSSPTNTCTQHRKRLCMELADRHGVAHLKHT